MCFPFSYQRLPKVASFSRDDVSIQQNEDCLVADWYLHPYLKYDMQLVQRIPLIITIVAGNDGRVIPDEDTRSDC